MNNIETSDLYPGVGLYTPQLVHKNYFNDISELSYNSKWFGTEKVDGYYECLVKENNKVYMFARSKSKKTSFYTEKINHVRHLRDWAMECLPNGTMLIGEIYVPGGTSKDVTSILGCKEDKAWNRQVSENRMLCFYVHDILKYNGVDYVAEGYSNDKRISLLYENIDLKTPLIPQIFIVNYLDGVYIDFEQALNRIFESNGEGIVFKEKDALYMPGKRNKSMFKIKQDAGNDLDFFVTGFVEPEKIYTGKGIETWPYWEGDTPVTKAYYYNWKMGVTLALMTDDLTDFIECGKVTSGFTDADREDMAKNPNKYLHSTVTIGAMSLDKNNYTLRHPRFIGWHESKPAHQCTIESVFG